MSYRPAPRKAFETFLEGKRDALQQASAFHTPKKGGPVPLSKNRAITWQQPTLAGPIVLLPLAARGLTAVFGMGTGGPPANGHQELVLPVRGEKQKLRAMCADKGVK
jgi:hypothetical protein